MNIRVKIFLAFILIVVLGGAIVVIRTISVNDMMAKTEALYQKEIEYNASEEILGMFEEIIEIGQSSSNTAIVMAVFTIAIVFTFAFIISGWIANKIFYYEHILDSIPFPLSITDMNRNWTFVNKPVEDMLNTKRSVLVGQNCVKWGAAICGTSKCGVECLNRGQNSTSFEQMGMDFKVDVSYIINSRGKNVGHIEIVQDITEMVKMQKDEALLVSNIEEVSASFVSSSKQIANGSQALAQGSTEQAASIEELSASIHDIAQKTKENAVKAERAAALANTIKGNAEKGNMQMSEMTAAVQEINAASQNISKVIKAIDDIAFQTNILALNAAVEAARAGQHGKGFAVVAEEVRNLAAKSAEAAKDTGGLIANSMEKAELGAKIADETAASLYEIVSGINESSQIVGEIATSSEEQSIGIDQINLGIDQVSQVVQQNTATAQESAAASAEMNDKSNQLESLVNQFKSKYGDDILSLPPGR